MIDPKSLRIGNYLLHDGKVIVVTDIRSNELPEHGYKGSVSGEILDDPYRTHVAPWLAKCSGIPLSEQELIRLGLENGTLTFEEVTIFARGGSITLFAGEYVDGIGQSIKLKYVHEMQNLYFALTGEEINYKSNDTTREIKPNRTPPHPVR